jgi:GR25 family glycosyltransferase involved in LPS biosynthesis
MFNIFVITGSTEEYNRKCAMLKFPLQCYHVPAQYLSNNVPEHVYKQMRARYNIKRNHLKGKIGCMFAHRLALYFISKLYQTNHNIILEHDATLSDIKELAKFLKNPPKLPTYLGGWIINPLIKNSNEPVQLFKKKRPKTGVNKINYDKFKILMTHSLYIPNYKQAEIILELSERQALDEHKHKAMDHFYADNQFIKQFIYPPIFIQSGHISEIDGSKLKRKNNNDKLSINYGLDRFK